MKLTTALGRRGREWASNEVRSVIGADLCPVVNKNKTYLLDLGYVWTRRKMVLDVSRSRERKLLVEVDGGSPEAR
jgi:hypothetical protein